jgi:hypothetical protein
VTVVKTSQCHQHPVFDVSRHKDTAFILDNHLQIRLQELEDEVEVGLVVIYLNQLLRH